eukprot:9038290-Pyramimonas_sp.AAC.2
MNEYRCMAAGFASHPRDPSCPAQGDSLTTDATRGRGTFLLSSSSNVKEESRNEAYGKGTNNAAYTKGVTLSSRRALVRGFCGCDAFVTTRHSSHQTLRRSAGVTPLRGADRRVTLPSHDAVGGAGGRDTFVTQCTRRGRQALRLCHAT